MSLIIKGTFAFVWQWTPQKGSLEDSDEKGASLESRDLFRNGVGFRCSAWVSTFLQKGPGSLKPAHCSAVAPCPTSPTAWFWHPHLAETEVFVSESSNAVSNLKALGAFPCGQELLRSAAANIQSQRQASTSDLGCKPMSSTSHRLWAWSRNTGGNPRMYVKHRKSE